MKRDMDFVRDILMRIESEDRLSSSQLVQHKTGWDAEDILVDHLIMLIDEVGFVSGVEAHSIDGKEWLNLRLTWQGHEYLDDIRDPEIWKQTKDGAEKLGGFSLEVVRALAKGYIKKKIEKHTDVQIDL